MADIDVVAENLVELLTNSVNMTDVFYDLFINPEPMEITLYQYNTENELVPVVVPNRAMDRKIALVGTVPPMNSDDPQVVEAPVGVCYINTTDDAVYFRVNDTGSTQWVQVVSSEDIDSAYNELKAYIDGNFVPNTRKINNKGLNADITLTASDVGALSSNIQYGSSLSFSNNILSLNNASGTSMSSVTLATTVGADIALSNLSTTGEQKLQAVKGYETGTVAISDSTLYTYIKGLYDASSDTGTDVYDFGGTTVSVPYRLASTKSKITISTYQNAVEQVYSNKGLAPYYVLDTTNQTVTLPMGELYGFITEAYDKANVKSRNIGEIVLSTIPLSDAGLHLLDGSPIERNGVYDDFVDYMVALYNADPSAPYFCTEAEWEAYEQAHDGVCGKFVYTPASGSDPDSIRLPKYSNKIYTQSISSTAGVLGNGKNLGFYDGTNEFTLQSSGNAYPSKFAENVGSSVGSSYTVAALAGNNKSMGVIADTAKSGLIADLSNITTALEGYWYIVIATSTKTAIQVNIDNVITDLNDKVDKSSLREIYPAIETYHDGSRWYRVYSDGWCEQGGIVTRTATTKITINLYKNYTDTNYSIFMQAQAADSYTSNGATYSPFVEDKTISGFSAVMSTPAITTIGYFIWETKGYLAT